MQRQFPHLLDVAKMAAVRPQYWNPAAARLSRAQTIWDLKKLAHRRTPRGPYWYTAGAAEEEVGLNRAYEAFEDIEVHPRILEDVSHVDTSREVLGRRIRYPFGIAPTGFTRLMHAEGETAGSRAAQAYGIPFALSTLGTTSPEDVRAAAPTGRLFFQLYMMKERQRSYELMERAWQQGFDTLLVTVDTPVAGARHRDKRNDMAFPPRLTIPTVIDALPRPEWIWNFLTTPPLEFAAIKNWDGTVGELLDTMFDPSITIDDLAEIRSLWPGKFVVKGIQTVEDAKRMADFGVDGIQLSNHGGRQLDRAPVPFRLLPDVVREVGGDLEIHVDTGIMAGVDIVASIALGATYTQIGRAYLYGLMAGGQPGVNRALNILTGEIERTMRLLGVRTLDELGPQHVTQLDRLRVRGAAD